MRWFDKFRQQKLFSINMALLALAAVVLLGNVLTIGVSAAKGQAVAPDATPLTLPPVKKLSNEFTKLAQMLEPSVVFIATDFTPKQTQTSNKRRNPHAAPQGDDDESNSDPLQRFFGSPFGGDVPRKREGSGSGFIVDKNGYIMTNLHVVEQADHIKVRLTGDKTEYKAKLIGSDPEIDVAVLKIDAGRALETIKVGNSESVQVGDWAVAIGAPFGLETSVTAGIVSATGRDISPQQFQRFIQTDAAINPGNSGGPLVNINGDVIGINTMIATSSGGYQGIGFALPINTAVRSYNQIIQSGKVSRGSIGIKFPRNQAQMEMTLKALGFKHGVIIESVTSGGPAEKGGLKGEDVLLALNGSPIKDGDDLVGRVSDMPAGTQVTIGLDRDGQKMDKKVTIGDRDEVFKDDPQLASSRREMTEPNEKPSMNTPRFGFGVRSLSPTERKELKYELPSGVMVTTVEENSPAEEIGIKEKDILASINRKPVSSFEDVKAILGSLKPGAPVAFRVMRPSAPLGSRADITWGGIYLPGTVPQN
ncbi:Do family serine endopeptidase [uncultured Paludibaculum sp.]|uniref:Do family serine endopeptidase n=1 Tax=uncultured Paludibaculum sp. TaxID=1765020 RepID=UPI002AAC392E|nr:Do family serine endopeptidase [uncultured Paludibaculum sp.]